MTECFFERLLKDVEKNVPAEEMEKIRRNARTPAFSATLYQLFIINEHNRGLTEKEISCIENKVRNALKDFPNVKVFVAISTTSGRDAHCIEKATGGRPRKVIMGTKVPAHIHIGAIGDKERSARGYVQRVHKRLKNAGFRSKIESKSDNAHAINYIKYAYRQADKFHQYGRKNFNFRDYTICF